MNRSFDLRSHWNTAWSGPDILVLRNDVEVDRIHSPDIERVVFVQASTSGDSGESACAVVELRDEFIVLPAATGFASRVHFERQAFWAAKACVYWADALSMPLRCLKRSGFLLMRREPCYMRVKREEIEPLLEHCVLEGPQSWEERRWHRAGDRPQPFLRGVVDPRPELPGPGTEVG